MEVGLAKSNRQGMSGVCIYDWDGRGVACLWKAMQNCARRCDDLYFQDIFLNFRPLSRPGQVEDQPNRGVVFDVRQ